MLPDTPSKHIKKLQLVTFSLSHLTSSQFQPLAGSAAAAKLKGKDTKCFASGNLAFLSCCLQQFSKKITGTCQVHSPPQRAWPQQQQIPTAQITAPTSGCRAELPKCLDFSFLTGTKVTKPQQKAELQRNKRICMVPKDWLQRNPARCNSRCLAMGIPIPTRITAVHKKLMLFSSKKVEFLVTQFQTGFQQAPASNTQLVLCTLVPVMPREYPKPKERTRLVRNIVQRGGEAEEAFQKPNLAQAGGTFPSRLPVKTFLERRRELRPLNTI